ncbi:MAG: tetratricopeptide repeat protein [Elusimicrobia bacterium]|nr:tetratricopeptide repeat protein [Elusimicrobiota bacterium]
MFKKLFFLIFIIVGLFYGLRYLNSSGKLSEYLDSHPKWEWVPGFYYYIGQNQVVFSNWDSAIYRFEKVVKQYPNTKWAPMAQFSLARVYDDTEQKRKAIEEYQKLIDIYPDSVDCNFAEKRIGLLKG